MNDANRFASAGATLKKKTMRAFDDSSLSAGRLHCARSSFRPTSILREPGDDVFHQFFGRYLYPTVNPCKCRTLQRRLADRVHFEGGILHVQLAGLQSWRSIPSIHCIGQILKSGSDPLQCLQRLLRQGLLPQGSPCSENGGLGSCQLLVDALICTWKSLGSGAASCNSIQNHVQKHLAWWGTVR